MCSVPTAFPSLSRPACFAGWFAPPALIDPLTDPEWAPYYAPLAVPDGVFAPLLSPPSALQTCTEEAVRTGQNLEILSLDIRRAFDSVPFASLRLSLRRLGVPEAYTDLVMRLTEHCQVRVITEHGLSPPFRPAKGIEQGEINAPLLWKIFYDPLLARLTDLLRPSIAPAFGPPLHPVGRAPGPHLTFQHPDCSLCRSFSPLGFFLIGANRGTQAAPQPPRGRQ